MNRDKQIEEQAVEEMARVIEITEQIARDAHCGLPSPRMYAKDLYWHGYRKQSEWISVEERLPEREGYYLTSTIKGVIMIGAFFSYYASSYNPQFKYDVTHWMPLPEPPKKGGE